MQNVLAVIYGVDAEYDSKDESEYDDSVLDKDFEMPVDQCESQDRPTMSPDSGLCAGTKNVLFSSSALKYQRFLQFINKVVY